MPVQRRRLKTRQIVAWQRTELRTEGWIGRRGLLGGFLAAGFADQGRPVHALTSAGNALVPLPSVGAIRWDAWYTPGSVPTDAVTRALTPQRYHHRLPFFAQVAPDGAVLIDGNDQLVMDREITLAAEAGIDFWAFVAYPPDSGMSRGLDLYRGSMLERWPRFCMFVELVRWGQAGRLSPMALHHIELMQDPRYMRVLDDRPLYFLGFFSNRLVEDHWGGIARLRDAVAEFRRRAIDAGAGDPWVVIGAAEALAGAAWAGRFGLDALGAYAIAAPRGAQPYAALAALAERQWAAAAALGWPVVPTAMSGWDRRPRIEAPVPWEAFQRPMVGLENHYAAPALGEFGGHLRTALDFAAAGARPDRPATVLIYAWNENDEGGWLIPTWPFDDHRLGEVTTTIAAWRAARR